MTKKINDKSTTTFCVANIATMSLNGESLATHFNKFF